MVWQVPLMYLLDDWNCLEAGLEGFEKIIDPHQINCMYAWRGKIEV